MTGQINEAPSSMRRCFNDFSHLATPQKFHWKSSVILDMTDEGCMYAARYPSQLHTSKHYELVPVSAYSVPVKKVYCLLFLDMFYHAKILQPDIGRPAKRAIPRSNSGLRFRAHPARAVNPLLHQGDSRNVARPVAC